MLAYESRKLKDVAQIIMGQSPPGETYNEEGKGLPFYQGTADFTSKYPKRRVYCISPTRLAYPGDILLSVRAPIGKINIAVEKCAIGRGLAIIRAYNQKDQVYLEFALKAKTKEWDAYESEGSVFGNIRKKDLEDLPIVWPPENIRRAIAHILGTLDDKIELNRRMNETLEEMTKAIFKSWFVDFDPVIDNALKAGNPIPDTLAEKAARRRAILEKLEKEDPNLPKLSPEIARLFPDSFEDSPLGPIPKGWRVDTMDSHFRITMGQSPPGDTYNENGDGLPFYQGRIDFGFRFPSRRIYCTVPTRIANKGDTLLTVRAPVGAINMAIEYCCIGRGLAAIRHTKGYSSYTYYFVHFLRPFFERF